MKKTRALLDGGDPALRTLEDLLASAGVPMTLTRGLSVIHGDKLFMMARGTVHDTKSIVVALGMPDKKPMLTVVNEAIIRRLLDDPADN